MRHLVVALAMALLLSTSAVGAAPGSSAFITSAGLPSVSVVDTGSNAVTAVSVGTTTRGVAVDSKGQRAYVVGMNVTFTNGAPYFTVYAIDVAAAAKSPASAQAGSVQVAGKFPYGVAVSPDGRRVYVGHGAVVGSLTVGAVSAIDVSSTGASSVAMSVAGTIRVGGAATGVTVAPDGSRVYVANSSGRVSVVDPAEFGKANPTVTDVVTGGSLVGLATSSNGGRLYAVDTVGGKLWVIDTTKVGSLADPVWTSVEVGSAALGVAVSAKRGRIFVTNSGSDSVTVIDEALVGVAADPRVCPPCASPVGTGPYGISVTSDGTRVYVVNQFSSDMSVLDGTTGMPILDGTGNPIRIALPGSVPVGFGNFLTPSLSITVMVNVVPDVVNSKKQGTVPVIVYGSESFDVHTADLTTIHLNGWPVKIKPNGEPMANYGDFNGDGLDDVMVHIDTSGNAGAQAASGDSATLEGQTSDGMTFQGTDAVKFLH